MHVIIFTDVNGSIGIGRYAGTYRIATEMRKHGWHVDVIDFMMSFSDSEILDIIKQRKRPDTAWVGFSSTFLMPREFDPFGNRTSIRDASEASSSIGLSLDAAQALVNNIRATGLEVFVGGAKLRWDIDGVNWIKGNAEDHFFKDFDFTNSQIEWQASDHIFEGEHLPMEIARGCIFKCKFCSYNLNGKRLWDFCKSPETIENEMIRNYDQFGTTGYMFSDDTYNDSPEKIDILNQMYRRLPFDLEFSAYARLDLIISKPETLPILIESGLRSVFFGIETFNHDSGKLIGKGMHPDRIKQGLIDIKDQYPDLLISTGFIAGLPYDTAKDLEDTIDWLESSPVDSYSMQVLSLGKNSEFGKNSVHYGYQIDESGKWFTDKLDYDTALSIADRAKFTTISSFTFYNRLRNIGYSPEQVALLSEKDKDDINLRVSQKKQEYRNAILN